ncbi:ubiquitin carboxyl-terminal hydrolase MINDY-2-like [Rhincodon typus]|uniref:ubiquitin carboxyl-terminal hydrolase MINDY-2-like n=1 Tax=Rhincodon typus TaxID=259920 RepID=UPI00202E3AB7|nr:ubiquitin carboxyl-terminal hydrolase MINDY-2-like [Rhincodon typus]
MECHDGAERGGLAVEFAGTAPSTRGDGGSGRLKGSCRPGEAAAAPAPAPNPTPGPSAAPSTGTHLGGEESEKVQDAAVTEKVREEGDQRNLVNKMGELSAEAESDLAKGALPGLPQPQQPPPPQTDAQIREESSPSKIPEGDKNHTASDQSLPGESQSIDSLESFSNLNSCPSSDLNSEGTEDRALALALQTEEYNSKDGVAKPSSSKERFPGQSVYHIKWIKWKTENTPIITQNENGPCPLLAIMNVLLLEWKIKLPPMMEIITAEQLMEYLGKIAFFN